MSHAVTVGLLRQLYAALARLETSRGAEVVIKDIFAGKEDLYHEISGNYPYLFAPGLRTPHDRSVVFADELLEVQLRSLALSDGIPIAQASTSASAGPSNSAQVPATPAGAVVPPPSGPPTEPEVSEGHEA